MGGREGEVIRRAGACSLIVCETADVIAPGLRSFHIRHSRDESRDAPVAKPVHVIFYRVVQPGMVEVVRVLHERMEPARHIRAAEKP